MIRRAVIQDVPVIAHMLRLLHDESPAFSEVPIDADFVIDNLIKMIEDEATVFMIEPGEGFMVGRVVQTFFDPRLRLVEQLLYVLPGQRGTSLAVRLVRAFELAGEHAGCKYIHVGSSTGINTDEVVSMYSRLGYNPFGHTLRKDINVQ